MRHKLAGSVCGLFFGSALTLDVLCKVIALGERHRGNICLKLCILMCTEAAGWSFILPSLTVLACTLSKYLFLIRCVNNNTQVESNSYFQNSAIGLLFKHPRIALDRLHFFFSPPPILL